jgi:glycosyltransferase involved in cell wall biosynthesis
LASLPRDMPVLVVDARSCDRTAEFARSYGATVVVRSWLGFVEARQFALSQVQTPWALALDADEALDDRLRDAILSAADDCEGYTVARDTYFCGRALRMWRGERLLRLFNVGRVRLEARPAAGGSAQLHERYVVEGTVRDLPGVLLHFSYDDRASYRTKFDRYTALEAAGTQPSVGAWLLEIPNTLGRLAWMLVAKGALLDGARGIYAAWWSAKYPASVRWKALARR